MRPLSYRGADVFVLAFSLVSRASYENIVKKVGWNIVLTRPEPGFRFDEICRDEEVHRSIDIVLSFGQWIPELQHYAPGIPVVLVGTKSGELKDPFTKSGPISSDRNMAKFTTPTIVSIGISWLLLDIPVSPVVRCLWNKGGEFMYSFFFFFLFNLSIFSFC